MGIDYSGGMVIGCPFSDIGLEFVDSDEAYEWIVNNDLVIMSPYYDCPLNESVIGFEVGDVPLSLIGMDWLAMLTSKADIFMDITRTDGDKVKLMGCLDVY